ncbi:hypothetical protein PENSPDRAFT_652867 [Peniophora sp. CONT]|nr:hypothetical protein PENSPDRAFT_652867 [Peniophora sp. CONT]
MSQQRPQFSRSSTVSTTAPKPRGRPVQQTRPAASVRSSSAATSSSARSSSSYGHGGGVNYSGASPLDAVIDSIDRVKIKDKQSSSYTYYGSPLRLGGGSDTIYTYYGKPLPYCRAKMDAERYQTIDKANGWGPYSSSSSGGPPSSSSSSRKPDGPPEISRPKTLDAMAEQVSSYSRYGKK